MLSLPFWMTVYFDAHDDALMLLFASGAYTGTPETHLIYNNILYGYFLSGLYGLTSKIEWYTLIQYLIQVISFNVFFYHTLRLNISKVKHYLYTMVLMSIAILLLIRPQYTFISSEVSLASIVLIFDKRTRLRYILAFLLFFIACNLRITAAIIPYIIVGPLMVFPFYFKIKEYRHRFIFFILLICTAGMMFFIDKQVYNSNSNWKKFTEYNAIRQYLIDNPAKNAYLPNIKSTDKYLEYDLIVNHRVIEGTIMSTADLQRAAHFTKKYIANNIYYNLYPYGRDYKQTGLIFICILLFAASLVTIKQNDKYYIISILAFILANIFCMTRSTSKIYLSMALTIPLLFVLSINIYKKNSIKWHMDYIIPVFVILFVCYRISFTHNWNNRSIEERIPVKELMARSDAPKISFLQMGMAGENAFYLSQSIQGQKFFRMSWATNSPHNAPFYKGFISYVDGMPILTSEDNTKTIKKMQQLLKLHYHIDTEVKILDQSGKYQIIQLIKK